MAQLNYGFSANDQGSFATQQAQQREYSVQQQQQYEMRKQFEVTQHSDSGVDDARGFGGRYEAGSGQGFSNERYATIGTQQQGRVDVDVSSRYATEGRQTRGNANWQNTPAPPDQQYDTGDSSFAHSKQQFEARRSRPGAGQGQQSQWRSCSQTENFSLSVAAERGGKITESNNTAVTVSQPAMTEDEYRDWLTKNFKHLFEPHESAGGMPISEFQQMVKSSELGRSHNLKELFTRLDKDRNNRVSWNEFFTGMKYTKKDEVAGSRKAFNSFVNAMSPVAKKTVNKQKQTAANEGEPIPEESYLEAYNCRPPPFFIPIFFVVCWILFIVYAVQMQSMPAWNKVGWLTGFPYISPIVFCPSLRHEVYRFVAYGFLHRGYYHIVFNTIMACLLGIPLESVHKCWRVAPVFLLGILIGSLACSVGDPRVALVGASGGVYSLIGAHYALVIMNWEELQEDWTNCSGNPLRFLLSGVMRLVYLTILVLVDVGLAIYDRYILSDPAPVSLSAHMAGLLIGLFAGVPILRNLDKKPWEGIAFIVGIVLTCLMLLFGIIWNIAYPNFPRREEIVCSNPSLAGL